MQYNVYLNKITELYPGKEQDNLDMGKTNAQNTFLRNNTRQRTEETLGIIQEQEQGTGVSD